MATTEEETPLVASHDATYRDSIEDMTLGRRLARFLSKYHWYNPHVNEEDAPSIDKAWAYFEHVTLARHFKPTAENDVGSIRMAEAGENNGETQLYSLFNTPEKDLGDFGVGIGTFSALQNVNEYLTTSASSVHVCHHSNCDEPQHAHLIAHYGVRVPSYLTVSTYSNRCTVVRKAQVSTSTLFELCLSLCSLPES